MKLKNRFKDIFYPLPTVKKLTLKYWHLPLTHLLGEHIATIISWILDEAKFSRSFGLFIRPEDLEKEILFFLTLIDHYGGVWSIKFFFDKQEENFKLFSLMVAELQHDEFEAEGKYYFERLKRTHETIAANAFICHLDSCRGNILNHIKYM